MDHIIVFFLLISFAIVSTQAQSSPDEALKKLKEGNQRFLQSNFSDKNFKAEIEATVEKQKPYAIVIACSDSRVAPETIFDESIGKLFVIRLAGNVVDTAAIGSIEYAVKYLGSSYLLMLGHSSCGAVGATVSGKSYTPSINAIAKMIEPAYKKVIDANTEESNVLDETIKENVYLQSGNLLSQSKVIKKHVDDGSLKIGKAVYDISTGKVNFLEE